MSGDRKVFVAASLPQGARDSAVLAIGSAYGWYLRSGMPGADWQRFVDFVVSVLSHYEAKTAAGDLDAVADFYRSRLAALASLKADYDDGSDPHYGRVER